MDTKNTTRIKTSSADKNRIKKAMGLGGLAAGDDVQVEEETDKKMDLTRVIVTTAKPEFYEVVLEILPREARYIHTNHEKMEQSTIRFDFNLDLVREATVKIPRGHKKPALAQDKLNFRLLPSNRKEVEKSALLKKIGDVNVVLQKMMHEPEYLTCDLGATGKRLFERYEMEFDPAYAELRQKMDAAEKVALKPSLPARWVKPALSP